MCLLQAQNFVNLIYFCQCCDISMDQRRINLPTKGAEMFKVKRCFPSGYISF